MTCSNNLRVLKLQEGDGEVYSFLVSEDEYCRATADIRFAQYLLDRHKSGEETLQSQIHNSPASTSMCTTQTGESSLTEVFWSDAETTLLISLYNDHKDAFTNAKKRKHVWDIIAEQMAAHNYFRNPKKLEKKWTNLLRVYRSIKDNKGPNKSGRGALHYKYFDLIDEIMGDKPSNTAAPRSVINAGVNNTVLPAEETASTSNDDDPQTDSDQTTTTTDTDAIEQSQLDLPSKKRKINTPLRERLVHKQKRHEERMELEKKKLSLEEMKINLFEKYLEHLSQSKH
ncbi:hypothetical protein RN001_005757 [Aquatica leii]|uniref:Myb-like domain-containing protein n=1 Tax=Aquatica leii TaxID=1421715 RepID=A0AAN7QKJ4_9COLE|nr:hypothetical protein RN001_005757 [Aquatica leii]